MVVPSLGRATVWRVFLVDARFRVDEAWYLDAKEQELDGASGVSLRFRASVWPDMVIVLGCPPALGSLHLVACCAGSQQAGLDAFGVRRRRGAFPYRPEPPSRPAAPVGLAMSQRRVAELAARVVTHNDLATALFISPKRWRQTSLVLSGSSASLPARTGPAGWPLWRIGKHPMRAAL